MTYIPPTTYLVVYLMSKLKLFAMRDDFAKLKTAMDDGTNTQFTDVDGEIGYVNGECIEVIYISTPETRANGVEFMEDSEEGSKPKWL